MSTLAISYTFSPTTVIESGQVNQNFTDIINYINNTASPVGLVALWKGSIASIPTGWAIDTDLRDKFALGAGNLYSYGATGGLTEVTLSAAESGVAPHGHTTDADKWYGTRYTTEWSASGPGADVTVGHSDATVTSHAGAAASEAHENMPPYYALAYIRRT